MIKTVEKEKSKTSLIFLPDYGKVNRRLIVLDIYVPMYV